MKRLTHASFFSGVGGLDLGFERAGIRTISHSEIDPYASAVLAERWPGVPNLGDIVALDERERGGAHEEIEEWRRADIWSGGFPCQDLSVAGKRAGFEGERSVLAFTWLNIVERHRPRWLVLENVPGLLSSRSGADFSRLLDEMVGLGYGVAWRTLDARFFGVPQRRRRVYLVAALDAAHRGAGADRAAQVLYECEGGCGHLGARIAQGEKAPGSARASARKRSSEAPDLRGSGEASGLAGRLDDREEMEEMTAYSIREDAKAGNFSATPIDQALALQAYRASETSHHAQTFIAGAYRKAARVSAPGSPETWVDDGLANTLNGFDVGDVRTTHAVVAGEPGGDDPLLPPALDGHRFRVIGNGVAAPVAEWIGRRLVAVDAAYSEEKEAQG